MAAAIGGYPHEQLWADHVIIGPAAMLAIGVIVFWLITRLPD